MDLPVVLIKLRDYILWFGPAYLLAIGLGATLEVALRRPLRQAASVKGLTSDGDLLYVVYWHLWSRTPESGPVSMGLYIWLEVVSQALAPVGLITTGALSWSLSLLRLGCALVLASLLALVIPILLVERRQQLVPAQDPVAPTRAFSVHVEWWRAVSLRFDESSNGLLLGIALGAAVIGLEPALYSMLDRLMSPPQAYAIAPALGLLLPLGSGTETPILAALDTKGVGTGALVALMLGIAVSRPGFLRTLYRNYGGRLLWLLVPVAWLGSAGLAWLVSLLAAGAGAN